MKATVHAIAGVTALICIIVFWCSTMISELFLPLTTVALVKQGIAYAIIGLVVALAITGASGFSLAGSHYNAQIATKKKRMPFIAGIGLLLMLPSALFLAYKASLGQFDTAFYLVQSVELAGGLIQMLLIGSSLRDGLRLSRRFAAW